MLLIWHRLPPPSPPPCSVGGVDGGGVEWKGGAGGTGKGTGKSKPVGRCRRTWASLPGVQKHACSFPSVCVPVAHRKQDRSRVIWASRPPAGKNHSSLAGGAASHWVLRSIRRLEEGVLGPGGGRAFRRCSCEHCASPEAIQKPSQACGKRSRPADRVAVQGGSSKDLEIMAQPQI